MPFVCHKNSSTTKKIVKKMLRGEWTFLVVRPGMPVLSERLRTPENQVIGK